MHDEGVGCKHTSMYNGGGGQKNDPLPNKSCHDQGYRKHYKGGILRLRGTLEGFLEVRLSTHSGGKTPNETAKHLAC